jgi:iron complex outermembrane recepter protein
MTCTGRPAGLRYCCIVAALAVNGLALAVVPATVAQTEVPSPAPRSRHLSELTPDELMRIEVTSVSKKPETRWRTPAAIAVITRDEIRRSGVTSIVEALRLAPGVQVARIDANKWAVGIRGFADGLTRSVLVLIDGRSVYSPLSAGTFWEVQDVLLEDVERIEVIRGPGGSLWGANAVNGVINVITRSSRETSGFFGTVGAGTHENAQIGLRYGGASGERLTYRVYGKAFDRGPGFHPPGDGEFDDWSMGQGGFRVDWENGAADTVEVHGDLYVGDAGHRATVTTIVPAGLETIYADTRLRGRNLAARWRHLGGEGVEWGARTYYDHTFRRETTFREGRETVDLELQRRSTHGRHDLVVGGGYRMSSGRVDSVPTFQFEPARRTDHLWSGFFRDEVSFHEGKVVLALGSKLEHNGYSGIEVQPTVQALWAPTPAHSLWAVVARAVRTPARLEHDLTLTQLANAAGPVFVRLVPDPAFQPEKVVTAEAGYRARVSGALAFYLAAFHNTHRDLYGIEPGTPFVETSPPPVRVVVPLLTGNSVRGSSYGVEFTAQAGPREWWHVGGSYSLLRMQLEAAPGRAAVTHEATNLNAPRHTFLLASRFDLGRRVDLDLMARRVSELAGGEVPAYSSLDARVAWRLFRPVELAVVGQNLLNAHHLEFINSGNVKVEARRGVYGTITWRP